MLYSFFNVCSVNKLKQAPSGDNQQWSRNNFAMAATAATNPFGIGIGGVANNLGMAVGGNDSLLAQLLGARGGGGGAANANGAIHQLLTQLTANNNNKADENDGFVPHPLAFNQRNSHALNPGTGQNVIATNMGNNSNNDQALENDD